MTIREQLTFLAEQLAPWAIEFKGRVEIAADPLHVLGLISTAPGSPRLVLMFEGEEKRGEYEETGKVDRKFIVVVSRGRGLQLQPGENLITGSAGGQPLYDLIEQAREMVRGLVFDRETTDGIPDYTATSRLKLEDSTVDAYQIEFSIGVQLPLHHQEEIA